MNIHFIYISILIISYMINVLLKTDLSRYDSLYVSLSSSIWMKVYACISIALLHGIWLFNALFIHKKDDSSLFGYPIELLIPIFVFLYSEGLNDSHLSHTPITPIFYFLNEYEINYYLTVLLVMYILLSVLFITAIPYPLKNKALAKVLACLEMLPIPNPNTQIKK